MTRTISAGADLAAGFAVVDGREAVRQRVVQRLRLFRGEAFLDAEAGVPYISDILGLRLPNALAGSIIAQAIRGVSGVRDVTDVTATLDATTRTLRITATVATDAGPVTVEESVLTQPLRPDDTGDLEWGRQTFIQWGANTLLDWPAIT